MFEKVWEIFKILLTINKVLIYNKDVNRRGGGTMKVEKIGKIREKAKLTPIETARLLGISYAYLNYIETGQRNPSDGLKEKMCKLYGIDMNTLFLSLKSTKCWKDKK